MNRGFMGVLVAASDGESPVPFSCPKTCFLLEDSRYVIISINNGITTKYESDQVETSDLQPDYSSVVHVINGQVKGDDANQFQSRLKLIYHWVGDMVEKHYNEKVSELSLDFGIVDNSFFLCDSSYVVTTPISSKPSSKPSRSQTSRKPIKTFSKSKSGRAHTTRTSARRAQTSYGRANEILSQVNEDQTEIYNAIDQELSKPVRRSRCVSEEPTCGPPAYNFPRVVIILHNIRQVFPDVPDPILLRMIKLRMENKEEQVSVCLVCNEKYIATQRISQCSKIVIPKLADNEPVPFQPLVEAELETKRTLPVGITPEAAEPHTLYLNLEYSPYKTPIFRPPHTPEWKPQKRSASARISTPTWANRLSGLETTRESSRSIRVSQGITYADLNKQQLPIYPPPETFAQRKAKKLYVKPPFNIGLVNPDRKKQLHKTPIPDSEQHTLFVYTKE